MVSTKLFILFEVVTNSLTILSYFNITRLNKKSPYLCTNFIFFYFKLFSFRFTDNFKGLLPLFKVCCWSGIPRGFYPGQGCLPDGPRGQLFNLTLKCPIPYPSYHLYWRNRPPLFWSICYRVLCFCFCSHENKNVFTNYN